STIRFVLEALQQRRARHRLRDILVLLLRTVATALVACAFARPLIGAKPLIAMNDTTNAARVIILDQSQSMAATSAGVSAFERARTTAANYLSYRNGLRANLILGGARPRMLFGQLTSNVAAL